MWCLKNNRIRKDWRIKFTDSCKYNHGDEDQLDWNKLCGIDFESPFSTMRDTLMCGWRYNPQTDLFELNLYTHYNGDRWFSDTVATVKANEEFEVMLVQGPQTKDDFSQWTLMITKRDGSSGIEHRFNINSKFKWATEINFYFGGNKTAPHNMFIYKEQLW